MALALGRLRITPRDFWALSMPELDAVLRGSLGLPTPAPLSLDRTTLEALCNRFPD